MPVIAPTRSLSGCAAELFNSEDLVRPIQAVPKSGRKKFRELGIPFRSATSSLNHGIVGSIPKNTVEALAAKDVSHVSRRLARRRPAAVTRSRGRHGACSSALRMQWIGVGWDS